MDNIKIGDIIKCFVTGITKYGIFVSIKDNPSYTGLIHISEISNEFVSDVNNFVKKGEVIYAQVLEINEDNKHINLSIKDINYKEKLNKSKIKETRLGFLPLKEKLPEWINEKLDEINKL